MRRFMTTTCVVGLLAAGAGVALAATPAINTNFQGSGSNSWNQGGSWVKHGTAHFTILTSGKYYTQPKKFIVYIKSLQGNYSTKCNGTLKVSAKWIKVNSNGSWSFPFVHNGAHVRIWGTFSATNKTSVNYVVNFSGSDTNPGGLNSSCATWVKGSARS